MANPSDKGARGPAGPLADPLKTEAPAVGFPAGAPPATPSSASPMTAPTPSGTSSSRSSAGNASAGRSSQSGPSASQSAANIGAGLKDAAQNAAAAVGQQAGASLREGLRDTAQSAAEAARQQAGASLRDGVKDTARTASDAVRQQAAKFAEDVGHELNKTGEAQKARGVEAIRCVARAIDSAADELENQSPQVASTVHQAARRVDELSDNLSNRNLNELIDSVTQLARSQPALFLGGSVAAGFALARFLKSSSARHRPSAGFDPYQR